MSMATWVLALLCVTAAVSVVARRRKPIRESLPAAQPSNGATVQPKGSLQLKVELFNRRGLAWRIHLRFAEGDNSYNYFRAGQVYVGLFRDPELAAQAAAFVRRECEMLSAVLPPTTLAEAELRPEDSAAFMGKLVRGEAITANFLRGDSIARLSVSCANPHGTAWKADRELISAEELDSEFGPLIAECSRIGDAAAAAAKAAS